MSEAADRASSTESRSPLPATSGTPTARAASRAVCLFPNVRSCSGVGPTNAIPADSAAAANASFSDRKPASPT